MNILEKIWERIRGQAPSIDESFRGNGPDPVKDEEELLREYSKSLNIPIKRDLIKDLDIKIPEDISVQYFKRMGFLPLNIQDGRLVVAISDPLNFHAAEDMLKFFNCSSISYVLCPRSEIESAVNLLYDHGGEDAEKMVKDLADYETDMDTFRELHELEDLMEVTHEAPIIRLVNMILTQALRKNASDIHIEPYEKEIKVRFRIDGVLYEMFSIPKRFQAHIVSRLKVMANLDIAEKRIPQDGRIKIKVANRTVDIRVSIIPMAYGERIVLRLLDKSVSLLGLTDMGMSEERLKIYESLIRKSNGIILVTGPTGSGKTTTLYASLSRLNSTEKNIITIEDPIEYELKGVGQIQVNPKTELTFARGLRSILRHDPDIIMVGEIRDVETAEIAIQASLTGHLVFSTLHTNDAAGAITRLIDMGVEPFLIASSLIAVLAQRLVRKVCPECKEEYRSDSPLEQQLGIEPGSVLYRGRGCTSCMHSGYRGRTGIFELLVVSNEIRRLITSRADSVRIKEAAIGEGMQTLLQDGIEKAKKGVTTISEVLRVTQE